MRRSLLAAATVLICAAMSLTGPAVQSTRAAGEANPGEKAAGADLFGLTRVVDIHLEIPADDYQAMQPPAPAFGQGGPPAAPRTRRAGERASERNLFGVEFPWARGALTAGGQSYPAIDLRYAGNASYMASAGGLKRSFLIELDRAGRAEFHGLHALLLQAGARPDKGSRGARLRSLPRVRCARPPHRPGRGHADRSRQV